MKTGVEALERRARAHANIPKILRWWNEGMTIKGMAWKLKTERASVQWIIRKAIDGGRIKPDHERLRYPSEPPAANSGANRASAVASSPRAVSTRRRPRSAPKSLAPSPRSSKRDVEGPP